MVPQMIITITMNAPENKIQTALETITALGIDFEKINIPKRRGNIPNVSLCCDAGVEERSGPEWGFVVYVCSSCEKRV